MERCPQSLSRRRSGHRTPEPLFDPDRPVGPGCGRYRGERGCAGLCCQENWAHRRAQDAWRHTRSNFLDLHDANLRLYWRFSRAWPVAWRPRALCRPAIFTGQSRRGGAHIHLSVSSYRSRGLRLFGGGDLLHLALGPDRTYPPSQSLPRRRACTVARAALSHCARCIIGRGTLWRSPIFRFVVHDVLALGRHSLVTAYLGFDLWRISIHPRTHHARLRFSAPIATTRCIQRPGQRLRADGISGHGNRSWPHSSSCGWPN